MSAGLVRIEHMFQEGVPAGPDRDSGLAGQPSGAGRVQPGAQRDLTSGDVFPLVPGALDRVAFERLQAEYERGDDPWLDEFLETGWTGPTPEEEEEIFLLDHPELMQPGVGGKGTSAVEGSSGETAAGRLADDEVADDSGSADDGWVLDEADDPAAGLAFHPAARVPARMPSVEEMPGGAELAAILASTDVSSLGAYELVEHIAACERVAAAMHALQATSITELARRAEMRPRNGAPATVSPERVAALEVAARLARTGDDAEVLVRRAEYLQRVLPDTFAEWAAGRLDTDKADLIGRKLCRHDEQLARRVEAEVLPHADGVTLPTLRRMINRALHRLDPKDADAKHQDARQRRFVEIIPGDHGMSWIHGYVPDEVAAAVKATLDGAAETLKRANPDDDRTTANRRADVLAALAWAALAAGRIGGCGGCRSGVKLADAHGRPVTVNVTLPASSLLGVADAPAMLAGFGPITAQAGRELAANAVWRRIITDPVTGAVLDVGRTRYRPPAPLAEHILIRDVTCVWPSCERPATGPGVDIDHIIDWVLGGATADHNLGSFCEKHHVDKHQTGWQVSQPIPGRFDYVSPTGHTYIRRSVPVGPTGTESGAGPPPDDGDPPPY